MAELQTATDYILTLPYDVPTYRMASLLCLLPAYQTILQNARQHEELFTPCHPEKISHEIFGQCLQDAQVMVADNTAILEYSQQLTRQVEEQFVGG